MMFDKSVHNMVYSNELLRADYEGLSEAFKLSSWQKKTGKCVSVKVPTESADCHIETGVFIFLFFGKRSCCTQYSRRLDIFFQGIHSSNRGKTIQNCDSKSCTLYNYTKQEKSKSLSLSN